MLPDRESGYVRAECGDLSGRFGPDREGQFALGERHTAITPDVDVIESDGLDTDLHLAGTRRRRRLPRDKGDLAVGEQLQRANCRHGGNVPYQARWTPMEAVRPPSTGMTAPVM